MKLSTAIIAALAAVSIDAKSLDAKTLSKTMKNVETKNLLRQARKLDEQQEQEDFQITSDFSIKFNSCASLKVLDVDDISDYITNAQYSGADVDISSLNIYKDYVIFDAISASSGQTVQYVVDVATYVQSLVEAIPNEHEEYCKVCEEAEESCYYNAYTQAADANNGGRKLSENYQSIDCTTCYNNGCFSQNEEGEDGEGGESGDDESLYVDSNGYTSSNALEWLDEISECQEISPDSGYNNYNGYYKLYAGLTCNRKGTGVEIGVFSNEECTMQSTQTTYVNIVQYEAQIKAYYEMTKTLVENAFTQRTSCAATTYVNPFEDNDGNRRKLSEDEDANEEDAENDEEDANADADEAEEEEESEEEGEISEICQRLTEENSFELSQSCDGDNNNEDGNGNGNGNYQYDEYGNAWGTYYYGNYGYISYDINDIDDMEQVCTAFKMKSGSYSRVGVSASTSLYDYSGKYTNTYTWNLQGGSASSNNGDSSSSSSSSSNGSSSYNETSNGDGFDWQGTKQQIGDKYNEMSTKVGNGINSASEKTGLEVEEIIGIIVGALAALCLFTWCGCYCCCKKNADEKQVLLIGEHGEQRGHKEWKAKDKWNTTKNRATWA